MSTAMKFVVYCLFMVAVYCHEYDVPYMMHIKRWRYLADWKLAAYAQRKAISSYQSYMEEAEYTRG